MSFKESEIALKKAIGANDAESIRLCAKRFYESTYRLVYRVLVNSFGHYPDIDDDVTEAYLCLFEQKEKIAKIERLADYLLVTAKNLALNRKKTISVDPLPNEDTLLNASDSFAVENALMAQDLLQVVNELLSPEDKEVVIRHAAYSESFASIGERLHLSKTAVAYRYNKSLRMVRKALVHEKKKY